MSAQFETVIVNNYGDTAQQIVLDPSWRSDYQRYLAEYKKAENKTNFNATEGRILP